MNSLIYFLVIIGWSVACACRRTDMIAYDSRYLLVGGGIFLQKHSFACMHYKFQPRSLALVMLLIIKRAHMEPLGVFYFGVSGSLTLAPRLVLAPLVLEFLALVVLLGVQSVSLSCPCYFTFVCCLCLCGAFRPSQNVEFMRRHKQTTQREQERRMALSSRSLRV